MHVPPRRNAFFTGRDALLERVHGALRPSASSPRIAAAALTGLGGIGKHKRPWSMPIATHTRTAQSCGWLPIAKRPVLPRSANSPASLTCQSDPTQASLVR
jgi:hypothetical protein